MSFFIYFKVSLLVFSYFPWLICVGFGISYNTASKLALGSIFLVFNSGLGKE